MQVRCRLRMCGLAPIAGGIGLGILDTGNSTGRVPSILSLLG